MNQAGAGPWRLVDDRAVDQDGAENMATDVALLDSVDRGAPPVLRLYRWSAPTLSLGHFQPDADVDAAACERLGVEVVRRPTGGQGLLHGTDLTYAVVIPRPSGADGKVDAVYRQLAGALVAGLARLGVEAAIARHDGPSGPVCFAGQQGADLRVGERKLCGSAQVRRRGAILQHGSILLRRGAFDETDVLRPRPGTPEMTRAGLHAATVTLDELGAPTDPGVVGDALIEGFAATLDITFDLTMNLTVDLTSSSSRARAEADGWFDHTSRVGRTGLPGPG